MRIYIMRHGEAEMLAPSDKERHLTPLGKEQAAEQGQWLKTALNSTALDKVIVSPYVRALETFEAINAEFNHTLSDLTESWDNVTPYGNPELVRNYLDVLAEENNGDNLTILIVSHLPLVGELVKEFCGKNTVSFHPATIAVIDWDWMNDKGVLVEAKLPSAISVY
ncbi:phosphohistidine phosphatase SixA [Actinobacillus porcinus]|uniref:phosphohistidine phosphatase SixA n=1 Tax=Actinobacillus porcinus TaxID=51048 RepID=UPI0023F55A20|nr:phosphohistidine phosphatase SixA [Actinobacillus porcinus]MDD7544811.1 phosphohistidine phosphatase SixA [Actinobacillus porcinus]MDY5848362.1 phosphohistidine phosphatase SixA [Actinobacillus porcinus]MDY6215782.1 phosphohistidine phosphatase SixA [Actinobacillus porcinus]